jgi:hypothetical protein
MNEQPVDIVEQIHRNAVARHWESERLSRELVEKVDREVVARHHEQQQQRSGVLIDTMHCALAESPPDMTPNPPPMVHYTELPDAKPDNPLYREWNFYRREAGRLLGEGNANRHVLVKGETIVGVWETHDEAMIAGYRLFPGQAFLVHQIQEREHALRCITVRRCPSLPLRFRLAS